MHLQAGRRAYEGTRVRMQTLLALLKGRYPDIWCLHQALLSQQKIYCYQTQHDPNRRLRDNRLSSVDCATVPARLHLPASRGFELSVGWLHPSHAFSCALSGVNLTGGTDCRSGIDGLDSREGTREHEDTLSRIRVLPVLLFRKPPDACSAVFVERQPAHLLTVLWPQLLPLSRLPLPQLLHPLLPPMAPYRRQQLEQEFISAQQTHFLTCTHRSSHTVQRAWTTASDR